MPSNTALLERFIRECWNERSRTICQELLTPDYEHFMPGVEEPTVGPDSYQQLVDSFIIGFPDTHFEIEDAFGEDERVCLLWTARGTHLGVFSGIEPTNRPVVIKGVAVARIVGGMIRRIVSMFDNASLTKQLDAPAGKAAESWKKTARSAY